MKVFIKNSDPKLSHLVIPVLEMLGGANQYGFSKHSKTIYYIEENTYNISITVNNDETPLLKKGYIEIDLEKLANLFSSKTTNEYPKVMRVSDNDGVSCERVVIAKNPFNNRYIAIQDALTIEEAINKSKTTDICLEWPHAEDIVEPKIIELSLKEISDKFNIPIESIRIKK